MLDQLVKILDFMWKGSKMYIYKDTIHCRAIKNWGAADRPVLHVHGVF